MDATDGPARRRVWLPAATVRACTRPGASDADGARLAERVATAKTAGAARAPRDAAALAELDTLLTAAGVDEWLSAYPGATGQVGALGVLARLLEDTGDPERAAQIRLAVDTGELAKARTLARGALAGLRNAHPPDSVTAALAAQLAATITRRNPRRPRAEETP